jgi:integral membrane sensor domain MASE1
VHHLIPNAVRILAVCLVAGFAVFVIRKSPITADPWKAIAEWVVIVVGGILIILFILAIFGIYTPAWLA